jgi:hypothetical protein
MMSAFGQGKITDKNSDLVAENRFQVCILSLHVPRTDGCIVSATQKRGAIVDEQDAMNGAFMGRRVRFNRDSVSTHSG